MTRLPRGELEGAGDQDDHTDRDRYGARQRRLLHLDRRQGDAQRKAAIPNTVQTKKCREQILRSYPTLEPIHIDAARAYAAELAREESLLPLRLA